MGYDVTFHPVSRNQLKHFVFDVFNDASVAESRAAELSNDPEAQEQIVGLYGQFPEWEEDDEAPFEATFAVAAAAIAGWLHPYWYARGQALSFMAFEHPEVAECFTPLPRLATGRFASLPDDSDGFLGENFTASGFISPDKFDTLTRLVKELAAPKFFAQDGLESLHAALGYARAKGLGLLEATDIVVPSAGEFTSNPENLRAHYLKRMDP